MDETNRSLAGSISKMSITESDPTVERLAPVSLKSSQKIHQVFHELIDNWKQYTDMEDGDRIAQILQNYSVEKQLEQLAAMQKEEIIEVFRVNLRKTTTIQEENELLTKRNREISEKLHRLEHKVGKAQVNVFDRIQAATMEILKNFHERELDLARKVEVLETDNKEMSGKVESLTKKVANLEAKNQRLTELNEENEQRLVEFSKKVDVQENEMFRLREQLIAANELAREKTEEALHEAVESQRVKTLILKERETANTEAARQKEMLIREMDKYKSDLEKELSTRHQRHKKEVEALNAKFDAAAAHSDQTIHDLKVANRQLEAEVAKYKRNFGIMEAQIKGDMKRSLAVNYHEMLNIVSSGTCRLPSPPRDNPFLTDTENRRPPSPKRTLGVQTTASSMTKNNGATSSRSEDGGAKKPMTATKFSSSVGKSGGGAGGGGRIRSMSCSRK